MNPRYRMPLMALGVLVAVATGLYWYLSGGRYQDTDDAYVQLARTPISTNVAGRVSEILARENQFVHRGEPLLKLDSTPFRIAIADARAHLGELRGLQSDQILAV
jgi:membrane fusion protein (multidrug efflux system)